MNCKIIKTMLLLMLIVATFSANAQRGHWHRNGHRWNDWYSDYWAPHRVYERENSSEDSTDRPGRYLRNYSQYWEDEMPRRYRNDDRCYDNYYYSKHQDMCKDEYCREHSYYYGDRRYYREVRRVHRARIRDRRYYNRGGGY